MSAATSPPITQSIQNGQTVEALLLDCDGLLVGTEALFTVAETNIFAQHGRVFTPEHKAQLIGHPVPEVGRRLAAMLDVPDKADELAIQLLTEVEDLISPPLAPLPGIVGLLHRVRGRVPTAVVSNSPHRLVDKTLRSAGLIDLFDAMVTLEDAPLPKPAPDLYLLAAQRLGVTPERSLAFEDSGTGVRAARAAGIRVIGVPADIGADIGADWHVPSLASVQALALLNYLLPTYPSELEGENDDLHP